MNKVVHFEIPYDDQDRAQKFYQDVIGWQIIKFPGMDYHMAQLRKAMRKCILQNQVPSMVDYYPNILLVNTQ